MLTHVGSALDKAGIPRHRHPRDDVGVGVVECQLNPVTLIYLTFDRGNSVSRAPVMDCISRTIYRLPMLVTLFADTHTHEAMDLSDFLKTFCV